MKINSILKTIFFAMALSLSSVTASFAGHCSSSHSHHGSSGDSHQKATSCSCCTCPAHVKAQGKVEDKSKVEDSKKPEIKK